jgi:hypothetical protein
MTGKVLVTTGTSQQSVAMVIAIFIVALNSLFCIFMLTSNETIELLP